MVRRGFSRACVWAASEPAIPDPVAPPIPPEMPVIPDPPDIPTTPFPDPEPELRQAAHLRPAV